MSIIKSKIYIIPFLIVLVCQACVEKPNEIELLGKYCNPNEESFENYKRLTLEKDSFYTYIAISVDGRLFNCGSWEIINNSIVLNSGNSLMAMNIIKIKHERTLSDSIIFNFSEDFLKHQDLQDLKIYFDGITYPIKQRLAIAKAGLIQKAKEQNISLYDAKICNTRFYMSTFGNILEDNKIDISLKENIVLEQKNWTFAKYKIKTYGLKSYYSDDPYSKGHQLIKLNRK